MLYTMRDLLKVARENQFAVPAFNISSFDMLKSIMEEVEAQNAAVRERLNEVPGKYEPMDVYPYANEKVKEVVRHKLTVLNTINKAALY